MLQAAQVRLIAHVNSLRGGDRSVPDELAPELEAILKLPTQDAKAPADRLVEKWSRVRGRVDTAGSRKLRPQPSIPHLSRMSKRLYDCPGLTERLYGQRSIVRFSI